MMEEKLNFPSTGSVKGNMPFIWQRPFGVILGAVRFIFVSITNLETLSLTSLKQLCLLV